MTDPETFRDRLRTYLRERADSGDRYVKAKDVARDLGCSAKRVGVNFVPLREEGVVEQWATGSTGATWEITIDQ